MRNPQRNSEQGDPTSLIHPLLQCRSPKQKPIKEFSGFDFKQGKVVKEKSKTIDKEFTINY